MCKHRYIRLNDEEVVCQRCAKVRFVSSRVNPRYYPYPNWHWCPNSTSQGVVTYTFSNGTDIDSTTSSS